MTTEKKTKKPDDSPLGAPLESLTHDQVRAKLSRKPRELTVPNWGVLMYYPLSLREAQDIRAEATGEDGVIDEGKLNVLTLIAAFRETFSIDDYDVLLDGDVAALADINVALHAARMGKGPGNGSLPVTFRTGS